MSKKNLFPVLIVCLSVTGLLFSYILAEEYHFSNLPHIEGASPGFFSQVNDQVCGDDDSYFNCASVSKSNYARFMGVPVAVLGICFYMITLLTILGFWFSPQFIRPVIGVFLFWIITLGLLVDLTLLAISIKIIKAICPLCLLTYLATFLLFGATLIYIRTNRINPFRIISMLKNIESPNRKVTVLIFCFTLCMMLIFSMAISYASNEFLLFTKKHYLKKNKDKEIATIVSNFAKQPKENIQPEALYVSGDFDAPVTIIEFSDFFCPYCRYLSLILEQLVQDNPGKIKVLFVNYPLDNSCNWYMARETHPGACELAIGAICAERQGLLAQYKKAAFENQNKELSGKMLRKILKESGVSQFDFLKCLSSAATKQTLKQQINQSKIYGISKTPTLYINQKKYQGRIHIEALQKIIDMEVEGTLGRKN